MFFRRLCAHDRDTSFAPNNNNNNNNLTQYRKTCLDRPDAVAIVFVMMAIPMITILSNTLHTHPGDCAPPERTCTLYFALVSGRAASSFIGAVDSRSNGGVAFDPTRTRTMTRTRRLGHRVACKRPRRNVIVYRHGF